MTSSPLFHGPVAAKRLFKGVPAAAVQKLMERSSLPLDLPRDGRLFEQGDAGGTMYVVKSGRIEISLIAESGKRVVFNQIGPGECIGEISLVDQKPRTAAAVALEDSVLLPIKRTEFFAAVQTCPQLAVNLLEVMCERMRWINNSVEEYATQSLEVRLARRLLMLQRNFSAQGNQVEISQTDLADFAGGTREATNKILTSWKSSRLIKLERKKICVLNAERLAEFAHSTMDP